MRKADTMNENELKLDLKREKRIVELQKKLEKTKSLRKEFESEFNDRLTTFITTAFGVVAALFWQTAITDTIKSFIPVSGAWTYEIFVALIVTFIAATAIFFISKFLKRQKDKT